MTSLAFTQSGLPLCINDKEVMNSFYGTIGIVYDIGPLPIFQKNLLSVTLFKTSYTNNNNLNENEKYERTNINNNDSDLVLVAITHIFYNNTNDKYTTCIFIYL